MRLSTWDLFLLSKCPKRWSLGWEKEDAPPRRLAREILLSPLLGRESRWTLKGVAHLWDKIYWPGREDNRENADESARELTLVWRAIKDILMEDFTIFPHGMATLWVDQKEISSAADFITLKGGELLSWVYTPIPVREVARSPLPGMESFLLREKVRAGTPVKKTGIVKYCTSPHFSRLTIPSPPLGGAMKALLSMAERKISYPSEGSHCKGCTHCD
jgi:hypothetical protein